MLDLWEKLLLPVSALAHPTRTPPFGGTVLLLVVMCLVCGGVLEIKNNNRGRRFARPESNGIWDSLGIGLLLCTILLWLTVLTLGMARIFTNVAFDLLFCILVLSSAPKFLSWALYPLRNHSRRGCHLWSVLTLLLLLVSSANIGYGLHVVCHMPIWQALLAALPFLVTVWGIGIYEIRELADTFRAACWWQVTQGQRVTVYTPVGKSEQEIADIVKGCDETLGQVLTLLEVEALTFKPEIFLFPDQDVHHKVLKMERRIGSGYAHGDCITLCYGVWNAIHSTVAHELAHVVREQHLTVNPLPLLDEGLACYIEHRVTSIQRFPRIALPTSLYMLAQESVFYDWEYTDDTEYEPNQKYAHALALIEYLIHAYGLDKLKQLLVEAGKDPKVYASERLSKAVNTVYGVRLRDLEKSWRDSWSDTVCNVVPQPEVSEWWKRFTISARTAMERAQEEAKKLGQGKTTTEHMLLGLLRDEKNSACGLLQKAGVCLSSLREELLLDALQGITSGDEMSFTYDVKRVCQLAFDDARLRNCYIIGTEHLLLGLLRAKTGLAYEVLDRHGVDRTTLWRLLDGDDIGIQ